MGRGMKKRSLSYAASWTNVFGTRGEMGPTLSISRTSFIGFSRSMTPEGASRHSRPFWPFYTLVLKRNRLCWSSNNTVGGRQGWDDANKLRRKTLRFYCAEINICLFFLTTFCVQCEKVPNNRSNNVDMFPIMTYILQLLHDRILNSLWMVWIQCGIM